MKSKVFSKFIVGFFALAIASPALAAWQTVGSLDSPIPMQSTKCNYRLRQTSDAFPQKLMVYLNNSRPTEAHNSLSGALLSQSLAFLIDENLLPSQNAINAQGETPSQVIQRLRQQVPGFRPFAATIFINTYPTFSTTFVFEYLDPAYAEHFEYFNINLGQNQNVLERECNP